MSRNFKWGAKMRTIVGLGLVASFALTGCSSSGGDDSGTDGAATETADLGLAQEGKLTVAIQPSQRPTSYVEDGEPKGMAIDFTDELAERMGLEPEYTALEVNSALTQVAAKRYDTIAMGLIATEERREMLDFSTPWLYGWYSLVTDSNSDAPKELDELDGRAVAVVSGSQQEMLLAEDYPNIDVRAFPDDAKMLAALIGGQVDGVMLGSNNVAIAQEQYPSLEASDELPLPDPESFPVPKGNKALQDAISEGIADIMNDGTYNEIYAKWHPGEVFPERLYEDYPDMPKYEG